MDLPKWMTDMTLYHYLAIGGGAVIVLALLLYFTPASKLKIPSIFLSIVGGLGAGIAVGVILMAYFGWKFEPIGTAANNSGEGPPSMSPPMPPGKGRGGPMMMPPGGGMMGGGGGRANSKAQLAALITKLDVLTKKPLEVTLSADQKKKVREQIQKLDEKEDLSDDEAKEKLDALLVILKDQRQTLEDAGYRWPGQGQGGGNRGGQGGGNPGGQGNAPANPFHEGAAKTHLQSLESQLGAKKPD